MRWRNFIKGFKTILTDHIFFSLYLGERATDLSNYCVYPFLSFLLGENGILRTRQKYHWSNLQIFQLFEIGWPPGQTQHVIINRHENSRKHGKLAWGTPSKLYIVSPFSLYLKVMLLEEPQSTILFSDHQGDLSNLYCWQT